jgi:predicted NACHT family NTPase
MQLGASITKFLAFISGRRERASTAQTVVDIETLVRVSRAGVEQSIGSHCGTMRILDISQSVDADSINTEVKIPQKLGENTISDSEELKKHLEQASIAWVGHLKAVKRTDGLATASKFDRLMIYGAPGAGKTTFLKRLAMQCRSREFQPDRVPAFVPLVEVSKSKQGIQEWLKIEYPAVDWPALVEAGRVLLLLDGVDEVEYHRFDSIRQEMERIARNSHCPIVVTCRVVAKDYRFSDFVNVELADFDETQIRVFATRWFDRRAKPQMTGQFLVKLEGNRNLADLATKPLLLTLLCLTFEECGDLAGSRASLYKAGLDVVLRKWDLSRGINRGFAVNVDTVEQTLEGIAYSRFLEQEYFFTEESLRQQAAGLLAAKGIATTGEEFVQIAASGVGLLCPRARGVYSFSHLTFQEFLSARRVASNPSLLAQMEPFLGEHRWREVWLLLSNLMDTEYLAREVRRIVDASVRGHKIILELLSWCEVNTYIVAQASSREPVRRCLTLFAVLDFATFFALDRAPAHDRAPVPERALDLALDLARALDLAADCANDRDLAAFNRAVDLDRAIDRDDAEALTNYLSANIRLIEIMNESRSLTKATREEIENSILLPPGP